MRSVCFVPAVTADLAGGLRRVARLALERGAELSVVDVVPDPPRWARHYQLASGEIEVQKLVIEERRDELEQLARRIAGQVGLDSIEVDVGSGTPFVEIIRRVLARGHDLVVCSESDSREPPLGATAKNLLRKCPCPVWVLRPSRARKIRVLVAVDADHTDEDHVLLNDRILEVAAELVASQDGELHLGHAWELYGEAALRGPFIREDQIEDQLRRTEQSRWSALERLAQRHPGLPVTPILHLGKGTPEEVLPAMVARNRIDTLVVGTVARRGLAGYLIGNTAEAIIDLVRCSVVAVKHVGFVSPVS